MTESKATTIRKIPRWLVIQVVICSKSRDPAYANLHIVYVLGNVSNNYYDIS